MAFSVNADVVRNAIKSVLQTRLSERVMRPSYGTAELVFNVANNASELNDYFTQVLNDQVKSVYPDFEFQVSTAIDESGVVTVSVLWSTFDSPRSLFTLTL
ncbi:hypothetical protein BLD44_028550 [Mastigocladus laminosus UU774]|nr:hypothetical protein BLD44_028550 [Mastigocladus laminosus UU774]